MDSDSDAEPQDVDERAYGGLPASEYADIVNYLQGKPAPAWFDAPHSWYFRRAASTFSLDDQGLLLRKGRYVLQDWESERVLTKLHVESGHMKPALSFPFIQRTFAYAGSSTDIKYRDDCARPFTNCKLCGRLAHLALFKKIDGKITDLRCVVKRAECGRGVDAVLEGIDKELITRHSERLLREYDLPIFRDTFGGLPASEYTDIVNYLRDGTTPSWFDSRHPWKFRNTEVNFSLNEHGLLMKKGRYVLQDWETESLLEKLHIETGHMKSILLLHLVKGKFVYAGAGSKGVHEFSRELATICTRCKLCRGPHKAMISNVDSVEFTKLRCVVRPAASGRGLEIVVEGVDEEKRREHNDRLEEEWLLLQRSNFAPVRELGKSAKRICPSESSESINKNPRIHPDPETESPCPVTVTSPPVNSPVLLPVQPIDDRATVSLMMPDDIKTEAPAEKHTLFEKDNTTAEEFWDTETPTSSSNHYMETEVSCAVSPVTVPSPPVNSPVLLPVQPIDDRATVSLMMPDDIKTEPPAVTNTLFDEKDKTTAEEFPDTETPTSSSNHYMESDFEVAEADPFPFFVCTPSGNIKCPEGFVPSLPSHKIMKKVTMDGKCELFMRAFMTRRSRDIPAEPRKPENLFDDSQSFFSTEYGQVYIPEGYKCTDCGISENEEGDSFIVEIHLQLQKIQQHS